MAEAGVRFSSQLYVAFQLDPESGDMFVQVEMRNNEGELQVITGSVQWEG